MQTLRKFAQGRWYECKPAANGTFYVHWTEGGRSKRKTTGARSLDGAQAFLDEWCALTASPNPGRVLTCADLWPLKYPPGRSERVESARKNLMATFGRLAPSEITQDMEDAYIQKRGVAPSTIRLELSLLRATWNHAVKKRLLSTSDLPSLDALPKQSPPRERVLDRAEVDKVVCAAEAYSRRAWAFVWLAKETGARRNAIQELTWSQVDWEIGVIHYLAEGAVQSKKRRASVPISSALRPVLERLYADRRDDYVIGAGGRINEALKAVGERAGVAGVTPHVFRHTAATQMVRNGVPLWVVAKILGNTVEQVEKVYAKFTPELHKDAVDWLSGRAA